MVLASFSLGGTWHSLRNLVLGNEDSAIKSLLSTQWYQEEKQMVCLNVASSHYSHHLTKNPSFANVYTKQLHSSSLLSATDLLVIKTFGPLITVCLYTPSQTFYLVMASYILLYFYLSLSLLLQFHSSALRFPAP